MRTELSFVIVGATKNYIIEIMVPGQYRITEQGEKDWHYGDELHFKDRDIRLFNDGEKKFEILGYMASSPFDAEFV